MPSYSTNLKQWGSSGSIWPDGYSYAEGEQPVDGWDNYFNSKVYNDITHLISVTNNDLLTVDGEHDLEGDTTITDGTRAYFGTSENFSIRYSASSSELLIVDEVSSTTSLTLTESGVVEYKGDEVVSNRDQITISGGDGLKNGNTINPVGGGTLSLDIEPADFAGAGLEDDGSDNLRVASSILGDGLKGGSGSAINIEPADFAGSGLNDDGADNLELTENSVTVAGNTVSLGGSTGIALGDLSNVTATGEGDGNGFDADTVDGQHATDLGVTEQEIQSAAAVLSEGLFPNLLG